MSPAQKSNSVAKHIGQLLIIGFYGTDVTPALSSMLDRIQPAGIILFARNIVNAQQTHGLLRGCQARVKHRLFTCVDLEGGRVDRFRNVTGPAPSAAEVFASGDRLISGRSRKVRRRLGTRAGVSREGADGTVLLGGLVYDPRSSRRSERDRRGVEAHPSRR